MNKICHKCGKQFYKPVNRSLKEWQTTKYCSQSCANSITVYKNCKLFQKGVSSWNKGKKMGKSFRNTKIVKNCIYCKKSFEIKLYRNKTAKYCSKECHNNDNLGLTSIHERLRKSFEYEDWRTKVFERDLYTCQICGEIGGYLQAHHIKSFSKYPELRLNMDNGQTLCENCHRLTENYGKRMNNIVAVTEEA